MKDDTNNSTAYLFEPKSPLVFRTGRPFDQAGDPVSLDFPLPSTLAGACRTAIGDMKGWNFAEKVQELKDTPVHGPLAALISEDGATEPLFPKPADAMYVREDKKEEHSPEEKMKTSILQLQPQLDLVKQDTWSDLPGDLTPVGLASKEELAGKPYKKGANWWDEKNLTEWLLGKGLPGKQPEKLGWSGPQQELRTHVQLESSTLSAATGQLFQTNNLSFSPKQREEKDGWNTEQYGLLARLPDDNLKNQSTLFRRIGGEGRIARVERKDNGWPGINPDLEEKLKGSNAIRLILATPALFTHGWKPGWIKETSEGLIGSPPGFLKITLQLKAFVTPRWEPVSGWDLVRNSQDVDKGKAEKKGPGAARAVRRMVPAGAVYWFEVIAGQEHLPELWLQPISDDEQDRNDGYGLALPGIWKKQ